MNCIEERLEQIEHFISYEEGQDQQNKLANKLDKLFAYVCQREKCHSKTETQLVNKIRQLESKMNRLQVSCSSFITKVKGLHDL